VQGNQLFFLVSRRPAVDLSEKDLGIFRKIDGEKTVAEIAQGEVGVIERLREWFEADILEMIPPAERVSAPHLVVIEPHMDDAALSVGGRLLHRRGRNRITILSVVKYSNFTSYWDLKRDYLNVDTVTALRLRESELAARLLGAEHRCLDWTDAPIRFFPADRWSVEELKRILPAVYASMEIPPDSKEVAILKEKLRSELERLAPDDIWIPMGLGSHVDHRTVRSACVAMLSEARGRLAKSSVSMYEDLPYNRKSLALQIQKAFAIHGTILLRSTEDVTDVFDEKLRLISVFASQFKRSYMEPLIKGCAERAERSAPGRLAEVYYRVQGLTTQPCESSLAPNRPVLDAVRPRARSLLKKTREFQKLVVMASASANLGRWRTDCDRLLASFPKSDITLYTSRETAWQVVAPSHERINVAVFQDGMAGWIRETLKAAFQARTVVVILWWGAGRKKRGWKGGLLDGMASFLRKTVVAQSLGDICLLLEEENRKNDTAWTP
jgi:LmbE family N-acetylglucosaminyl deacetylase